MAVLKYNNQKIIIHSDHDYDDTSGYSLHRRCKAYSCDEPKTLEWLNTFEDNTIFYDIGSNIGGFSFIANMINKSVKIYSFEPNFMNFYTQIKTCKENKIKNFFPFNVAINDENTFNSFKYSHASNGGDGTFGDTLKEKMKNSKYGNPFNRTCSNLEIGILGVSLDSLVYDYGLPSPDYCKIDVDGNELLVLKGANRLLKEGKIKEIFVEIDDDVYPDKELENFIELYQMKKVKDLNVGSVEKPIRMVLYEKR